MAFQIPLISLFAILRAAAGNPLIQKFVDHLVAGTMTNIDNWVWAAIKVAMGVSSEKDAVAKVAVEELAKIQEKIDSMDPVEKQEAKKPTEWHPFDNAAEG